jgi:putative hydrolase of the HAD superfamily
VRAVLFDVDDTLVDHKGAQRGAIVGHLRDLDLPHDEQAVRRWADATDRHFLRHLSGELTLQEHRRERVRELMAHHDIVGLTDDDADEWFTGYTVRFEAGWRAYDDVPGVLDSLHDRGVLVGIISNYGADHQRRKLSAVGLGDRFHVVVGLDTLGFGKPDPRIFKHACDLSGTTPGETAYVGDRLDYDAVAARDAGLVAVWLDRDSSDVAVPDGVTRIGSLDELEAVLR